MTARSRRPGASPRRRPRSGRHCPPDRGTGRDRRVAGRVLRPVQHSGPRDVAVGTAVRGDASEDVRLDGAQWHSRAAKRKPFRPPFRRGPRTIVATRRRHAARTNARAARPSRGRDSRARGQRVAAARPRRDGVAARHAPSARRGGDGAGAVGHRGRRDIARSTGGAPAASPRPVVLPWPDGSYALAYSAIAKDGSLRFAVRRAKAPFLSGSEPRPAIVAPAGSSRSGRWR